MIRYALLVIIYTLILWLVYRTVLRRQPYFAFSRIYLWLAAMLPLVLPFIKVPQHKAWTVSAPPGPMQSILLEPVVIEMKNPDRAGVCMLAGYIAIGVMLAGRYFIRRRQWMKHITAAPFKIIDGIKVYHQTGMGPGSIGNVIFIPGNAMNPEILRHEQAHITLKHRSDLIAMALLRAACWPNLILKLIESDLRAVHEYQADAAAHGDNKTGYATLLLQHSFGLKTSLAHLFFHHPLKNRINMLYKNKSRNGALRVLIATLSISAIIISSLIFVQCSNIETESVRTDKTDFWIYQTETDSTRFALDMQMQADAYADNRKNVKDRQNSGISISHDKNGQLHISAIAAPAAQMHDNPDTIQKPYTYVDEMPELEGGINEYLVKALKYPDAARRERIEGRSIVKFVVSKTGQVENIVIAKSSGNQDIDAEALRAVAAMPAWKPGRNKGQPVSVYFTLPITFKLGNDKKG